jgi:methyl-accepting chemotaxis protein
VPHREGPRRSARVSSATATTAERSRNIVEAATGSGIATAAQVTSAGVAGARQLAEHLEEMSRELPGIVDRFRLSARR